jgi:hypothetical protein
MPGKLSKTDEKKWRKAKHIVRKQKGSKQSKFTDRDWGLVTHIFKKQKKAAIVDALYVIATAFDAIDDTLSANCIDDILENI